MESAVRFLLSNQHFMLITDNKSTFFIIRVWEGGGGGGGGIAK